ncbi:hypothetical protein CN918_28850 [Priestia megaterium]|nr:hypothetical protein CN918_28850 [Priestia megaterium]
MDYIWLTDESPILSQIPTKFKSAALILHPFIQMSLEWEETKKQNPFTHVYPDDEEMLKLGKPVSWSEIMNMSGLNSYHEVALSLLSSIGALSTRYARRKSKNILKLRLEPGVYFPPEDTTPVYILEDVLKVMSRNGAATFHYSEPLCGKDGVLYIEETIPLDIIDLAEKELILIDENKDFVFMNMYDSFVTLFISTEENIEEIIKEQNWEAIICDNNTTTNWYFE